MSRLSSPIRIRDVTFPNRAVLSPMCQYSASDGYANDRHLVHLGRFALGGFGAVVVEATAVSPEGRITNGCLGLWSDRHVAGLERIAGFIQASGAVPAIQLGHAGPKASIQRPWDGNGPLSQSDIERGDQVWDVVGPTDAPFDRGWLVPARLDRSGMTRVRDDFVSAAERALACGFKALELHAAHGYLLHSFLSPFSNTRSDDYGGSIEGRWRFPLEVMTAVRAAWPAGLPLFVRISASDGFEGGWTLPDSIALARRMKAIGVDVVDCSSGGINGPATASRLPRAPGFQLPFAEAIRREAGMMTMGVGLIRAARQAEDALRDEKADLIAIGREALADSNWALRAMDELDGATDRAFQRWPKQTGWWLAQRERSLAASRQGSEPQTGKADD